MEIQAYCIGCIRFVWVENPIPEKIGIGKKMGFTGKCPNCKRKIFTLNKKLFIQEKWGKAHTIR